MDGRREQGVISGWQAVLLAPVVIPFAALAALLARLGWVKPYGSDFRPEQVADYLRAFIEGTDGYWDWDDFENMRLDDPALEAIRQAAVGAGPPICDIAKLKECLARTEALIT